MKVRTRKLVLTRMILANNRAKATANPLRTDPTRTTGMREHFCRFIDRQFDRLKADVLRAVGKEDWLGVGEPVDNYDPEQERDAEGKFIRSLSRIAREASERASEIMPKVFQRNPLYEHYKAVLHARMAEKQANQGNNQDAANEHLDAINIHSDIVDLAKKGMDTNQQAHDSFYSSAPYDPYKPQKLKIIEMYRVIQEAHNKALEAHKKAAHYHNDEWTFNQLYQPFVCNGEVGYFPSRGLIEVPDVRQDEATSCGAAAAMSVGKYHGVGPDDLAQWKVALGTSEEGTHPEPIVKYLRSLGLQVEAFRHGNLGTLDGYLDRGWPVLCCVQDYGPSHSWEHGHYLVVIGHKEGYLFAQDPAMDNVMVDGHSKPISELGSLHVPGRVMIPEEEFVQAWHDEDEHGVPYVRFGIAVGPKVVANSNPNHDREGRFTSARETLVIATLKSVTAKYGTPQEANHGHCNEIANETAAHLKRFGVKVGWGTTASDEYGEGGEVHAYISFGSKYYDAEDPLGVDHPSKLTFFKRHGGLVENCNPSQMRGADGRCGPGIGLDIKREDMPQIRKDDIEDFFKFCAGKGVSTTVSRVSASELKPTQGKFRQERVDALPDEALEYKVLVSEDNYILDGTHRWIKHWQRDKQSRVPVYRIGLPVQEAIDLMRRFPKAQFVGNARPEDEARDEHGRWTPTPRLKQITRSSTPASMEEAERRFVHIIESLHGKDTRYGPQARVIGLPGGRFIQASVKEQWNHDATSQENNEKERRVIGYMIRLDFGVRGRESTSVEKEIEPDSLNMLRHLRTLAIECHRAGFKLSVGAADDRRHQVYTRQLASMGFKLEGEHRGEQVWNTRWAFATSSGKLAAFGRWLKTRVASLISGRSMREAWRKYIEQGWRKGASRAFDDTHQRQKWERHPDTVGTDLYTGGREEFLRSSFNHPESVEKVKLLAARTFTDLDGVTTAMSTKMTRTLADGLTMGQHPHQVAASLVKDVAGIGQRRARMVAQHNFIYAHSEGQLDNLERLGVEEVGVAVEWAVTDDQKLCPACAAMRGIVLKTKKAHGLIPYHVGCRCAFVPSFDPPSSPEEVEAAVQEGDLGADPKKGVYNADVSGEARDDKGRWLGITHVKDNVVEMSPSTYLSLAMPFGKLGGRLLNEDTVRHYVLHPSDSNPMLSIKEHEDKLQVGIHDGRHRALAAQRRGYKTIKVDIVRGKKFARENPTVSDEQMAKRITVEGLLPEMHGL